MDSVGHMANGYPMWLLCNFPMSQGFLRAQNLLHETLFCYSKDAHKECHRRALKHLFNELGFSFGNNREF